MNMLQIHETFLLEIRKDKDRFRKADVGGRTTYAKQRNGT